MPGFIQITDTHIVAPGTLACGRSDTAAALRRAIDTINARRPRLGDIACVVVTGDLTDHGTPEEYAHFTALMRALDLPWMAVPGNHDRREAMRAALADAPWMPASGPVHWAHDLGAFCLIGLDTLQEGAPHGLLTPEGLDFADRTLSAIGDQPAIVATHHPWMVSGIPAMDAQNLRNGAALMERLQAHPGGVRMISGHVHRAMTGQIGGITCQIAPAPCHAVDSEYRPGHDAGLMLEPGAITVYRRLEGRGAGLISDIIPTGVFSGPWPFEG